MTSATLSHLVIVMFQCVSVVFNPSERECVLCSDGREIVGTVGFLFGDEVSRQRMRRYVIQ